MTQEEKDNLILTDLSARLRYGVMVHMLLGTGFQKLMVIGKMTKLTKLDSENVAVVEIEEGYFRYIKAVRPYLRPMESMTEEERNNLRKYCRTQEGIIYDIGVTGAINCPAIIDFLNSHHFDYRGLIPMGLALPAKDGIYNI